MSERKKALYSEEFQAMLERIEKEDYEERISREACMNMRKNRLCIEQVKVLEKHFEEENKLQPERKMMIAEELGLEPRQVAVWFQNRRARSKSKQLEREYDELQARYHALKLDYGSLEQEKTALLSQLKDLKAKIEARNLKRSTTLFPSPLNSNDISNEIASLNASLPASSASYSSSPTTFDGCQLVRMEELGMFNNEESCNFFSVDQAPTLYWHQGDKFS